MLFKKNSKMKNILLSPECDPMGSAIAEFHATKKAAKLRVFSSQFDEDEIPAKELFRTYKQMPKLEQMALKLAKGRILDVGAGSGCHALALQDLKSEVCAIDISQLSVETMKERGVLDARQVNIFDEEFDEKFDTILMLMNGAGIIGKLSNMAKFFERAKSLLTPDGSILMDSSDLKYLFEDEDGSFEINLMGEYYGQIDFQMQYKDVMGERFDWLYIDFQTLSYYANENGFEAELVSNGSHYDYLAKLRLVK